MSWHDADGSALEAGLAASLLANIRFDPKDPDAYFNWHETRGISRAALEAVYRDPRSRVRDLRDLLDEAADSTTLDAIFKANKKRFGTKSERSAASRFFMKLALVLIVFAAGLALVALLARPPA